jgi:voltage-gated potassium channel
LRRRAYEILDQGAIGGSVGRTVNQFIVLIIVISLVVITFETVPELAAQYQPIFEGVEAIATIVFTVEYILRIWVAAEHPVDGRAIRRARLRFMISPLGLIDLFAVLPFWLAYLSATDLRFLLVLRIFRFLKLARYSPAMRSLLDAVYAERRALVGCFVVLIGATLFAASIMYLVERDVQPDKFGTIPGAMWWAIVTLGTIGYGDVIPVTPLGRVVASITIFAGLIMVALPVGVIASAFAEVVHRRDFIITWGMVARVPLFGGLNAQQIADIMQLLRAQRVETGAIIARRGEAAHSMYFIAAGEVEIELKNEKIRLGAGHFFGEIAVLHQARRSATVIATANTSLLALGAQDLHALMDREPQLAERIRQVMHKRLHLDLVTPHGDLVAEELDQHDEKQEDSAKKPT